MGPFTTCKQFHHKNMFLLLFICDGSAGSFSFSSEKDIIPGFLKKDMS